MKFLEEGKKIKKKESSKTYIKEKIDRTCQKIPQNMPYELNPHTFHNSIHKLESNELFNPSLKNLILSDKSKNSKHKQHQFEQ